MRHACAVVVLALLVAACGGQASVESEGSTAVAAEPTAEAAAEPTTAEPTATSVPATPEPPTPEPTTPEPTVEPESATNRKLPEAGSAEARNLFGASTMTDNLSTDEMACALDALASDPSLLGRTIDAGATELLPIEDQADLAAIAFDCAPERMAAEFAAGFEQGGLAVPPEVPACFVNAMSADRPNRDMVILGFAALGEDRAAPSEAQGPTVDTMVECFPGSVIGEAIAAEAALDPAIGDAIDSDCIGTAFDGDGMRPIWELLVENPGVDLDDLDPVAVAPMYERIISCVSISTILANEFAALGLELSDETKACIDAEAAGLDASALTDESNATELGLVMLSCLQPDELAALGGS